MEDDDRIKILTEVNTLTGERIIGLIRTNWLGNNLDVQIIRMNDERCIPSMLITLLWFISWNISFTLIIRTKFLPRNHCVTPIRISTNFATIIIVQVIGLWLVFVLRDAAE